ncbi:hypothetical protein ANN_13681 [Periplaneta americana]|uniref:DUF659 domain-containing protein n=1 Tax=Periplaneta americana TaxID=6978 RepID=A0ABQ8TK30_PERAM|nr:hypothetical protein ANN_13681 [Periplaneta americana]
MTENVKICRVRINLHATIGHPWSSLSANDDSGYNCSDNDRFLWPSKANVNICSSEKSILSRLRTSHNIRDIGQVQRHHCDVTSRRQRKTAVSQPDIPIFQCAVSSTQKFLVQQHITTSKHQANKQLNSKQRQLFLTQPTTSNVRSEFNIDLCRSLISADIPLYKLKNKVFREFLEKYTQHTIPDESTLRKTYAPSIYDETIQKIRDEIKDSSIWVSIDETPDKEGRLVGNVVIGLLSEQYSERILLHCDVLEKCNNKTIVKLFNEAMGILWPKGIMYDNVLFFISDAAPYMVKAGQALSVVYPKLTHFTCVAHAFHRVAEVVRDNFLK